MISLSPIKKKEWHCKKKKRMNMLKLCIFDYQYIFAFFSKHALSDIMVYSVNQSVLDIVKTASVVITPVVYVTTDVMMHGWTGSNCNKGCQNIHINKTLFISRLHNII